MTRIQRQVGASGQQAVGLFTYPGTAGAACYYELVPVEGRISGSTSSWPATSQRFNSRFPAP